MSRDLPRGGETDAPAEIPVLDEIQDTVGSILRVRTRRARYFDAELFGEPAWDIVLLLANESSGSAFTIPQIAVTFGYPPSVVERWLGILETRGQVRSSGAPDRRLYRLTDAARRALAELFADEADR